MNVYDVRLDENNELVIDLYKCSIREEHNYSVYHLDFESSLKTDYIGIKTLIAYFRNLRYFNLTRLEPDDFFLLEGSWLYTYKSFLLSGRNRFLEKTYVEEIINGMTHILVYIVYVDMFTGDVKVLKVNDLGIFSEEKRDSLEEGGYKHISESFLGKFLGDLNTSTRKPMSLNRHISVKFR